MEQQLNMVKWTYSANVKELEYHDKGGFWYGFVFTAQLELLCIECPLTSCLSQHLTHRKRRSRVSQTKSQIVKYTA